MQLLLTTAESQQKLPLELSGITVVNAEDSGLAAQNADAVVSKAESHHLAYVIYTSGSTGSQRE